jgi:acetyl esterase/lipase
MKNQYISATFRKLATCMALIILSGGMTFSEETTSVAAPQLLWPDGMPDQNGLHGPEIVKDCIQNISIPTITVHRASAAAATGAAVVVMPGGGYGAVCVAAEGDPIARILNERGITAVMLKYRLPNQNHLIPANDARRAIRTVRAHAAEWGIDPKKIGVWGFSAGGHLASTVTTVFDAGNPASHDPIERVSSRPDFSILFYPVISMKVGITHGGSRQNLIGSSEDLIERYSNELNVTAETPPCFLLHCSDDKGVPVENSLRFYQALVAHKVPATCLIYEAGGHGPGAFQKNPSWVASIDDWFRMRGCMK